MFLKVKTWLPLAVSITLLCGLVCCVAQQIVRISANDAPVRMSEDLANREASGDSFNAPIFTSSVDIGKSLTSYVVIYDEKGEPTQGSGKLDNSLPNLPEGVFEYARVHGQDRVTWQPKTGVRSAIVVTYFNNGKNSGFVMAGRSLREVERLEKMIMVEVGLGWMVIMGVSFGSFYLFTKKTSK